MALKEEQGAKLWHPEFKNLSIYNTKKRLELMKKREEALRRSRQMGQREDYEFKEESP